LWTVVYGQWNPSRDAEGGRVLAGRGAIRRTIPRVEAFQIVVGVDRHEADAVELHFGLKGDSGENRYVLRLSKERVVLGEQDELRGEISPKSVIYASGTTDPSDQPAYQDLKIERAGGRWRASFNGHAVGEVPVASGNEVPVIELLAEGGVAYFGQIEFTELVTSKK
jgi:hypothetical protein